MEAPVLFACHPRDLIFFGLRFGSAELGRLYRRRCPSAVAVPPIPYMKPYCNYFPGKHETPGGSTLVRHRLYSRAEPKWDTKSRSTFPQFPRPVGRTARFTGSVIAGARVFCYEPVG